MHKLNLKYLNRGQNIISKKIIIMNRTFLVFLSWSIGHLPRLFLALAGALTSVVVVVSRVGDPATALGSAGSTENI